MAVKWCGLIMAMGGLMGSGLLIRYLGSRVSHHMIRGF